QGQASHPGTLAAEHPRQGQGASGESTIVGEGGVEPVEPKQAPSAPSQGEIAAVQWVEVTGRTVEEAKEAALDQLGVDEQDAEFEVLEEPKSGLFGRLRTEARVRARVVPTAPRPKVERRDRKRAPRERRGGEARPS